MHQALAKLRRATPGVGTMLAGTIATIRCCSALAMGRAKRFFMHL